MQLNISRESLKPLAEKLVARLNDMGVVAKTGKPLVVDQGYEALAALFGYRNQHVLRDALKQPPVGDFVGKRTAIRQGLLARHGYSFECDFGLDVWVVCLEGEEQDQTHASKERAVESVWADVVYEVMAGYHFSGEAWDALSPAQQEDTVMGYLQAKGWSVDRIPSLQAAGYTLCTSDFKRPYWERGDEASEDFDTEEQAWMDAWRHAKARFVKLAPETEPTPDMAAAIQQLVDTWAAGDTWGQHPHYGRADWQYEVSNGDTHLGYWEWVVHQIDANGGKAMHGPDGAPLNEESPLDSFPGSEDALTQEPNPRATATRYAAFLRDMTLAELRAESDRRELSTVEGLDEAALTDRLLTDYDLERDLVLDDLVAEYDFGDGLTVAATGGREYLEHGNSTVVRQAVFLEDDRRPHDATRKLVFVVEMVNNKAVSVRVQD